MSDNLSYLGEVFNEAEDSLDGIATVQHDNKVRISSMQPALPMLDLHGITRADIHTSMFAMMQERLLLKVDSLENRGLTKLLDRCFKHIGGEELLRLVCLRIMEKLPKVDDKYLVHISENPELYAACPLEVKRQIWQTNQGLFGEAVSPLLDQYIAEKESILYNTHSDGAITSTGTPEKKPTPFLSLLPKTRRQSNIIQELVTMVGTLQPLYSTLLQFLKTLFLRTQISHYCTLRSDLLMSLHDKESNICSSDRCYKFAWCLNACIRVGHLDGKKARELYTFLEGINGGDEMLADVAMLLRDPYALHAISKSILQCLNQLYEQARLPRESNELECLVRLLQLGLKSLDLLESKEYYEDNLDVELLVKFLPELLSLMVENSLRGIYRQLKEDCTPYAPSNHFTKFISKNEGAMYITCSYAIQMMERKKLNSLSFLLPAIAQGYNKSDKNTLPDVFLHSFVLNLNSQRDTIKDGTLQAILKEFWLPCCRSSEQVFLHLCRMLWTFHSKIKTSLLNEILETIATGDEMSSVAQEQYQTLLEHITTQQII